MVKVIFGVVAFIIALVIIMATKAVRTCTIWMDDSFRWGGRDGNGLQRFKKECRGLFGPYGLRGDEKY